MKKLGQQHLQQSNQKQTNGFGRKFSGLALVGLVALSLSLTLLNACRSPEMINRVPVSHTAQYTDIPAPLGFEMDTTKNGSWVYRVFEKANLPMRSCLLIYRGERPVRDLVPWYKRQMAQHQWVLGSEQEGNVTALHYTKGIERAEIQFERVLDKLGTEPLTEIRCRIRPH